MAILRSCRPRIAAHRFGLGEPTLGRRRQRCRKAGCWRRSARPTRRAATGLLDTRDGAARSSPPSARSARLARNPPPGMTAEQLLAGHYREVIARRCAFAPGHRRRHAAPVRRAAAAVLGQPLHRLARSRAATRGLVGAFERDAIRPHIAGRFETLLVAATTHPAMLRYLDNCAVGRAALAGRRAARRGAPARRGEAPRVTGINENLAREVLELHTLGAEGARAAAPTRRPT